MKIDANVILLQKGPGGLREAFDQAVTAPIGRPELLLSSWLKRQIPPRDYLLGNVLCTTSRWIIYGETGVGKTLFAVDMAASIASGSPLLNWTAGRPRRVMYIDGELPEETMKERLELIAAQYGGELPFTIYSREVLSDGEMMPLNSPAGEAWLWQQIELVQPDVIFFDSIMCLLQGNMSEEESWAPIKVLMRRISAKRIAQVWLHHTGHDTSKGYGTKTREWELDTVLSLTKATPDGNDIMAEFTKARLRVPATAEQFAAKVISRGDDGWISDGVEIVRVKSGKTLETMQLKKAINDAYDRLADAVEPSSGLNGSPVRRVALDAIRDDVKRRGLLDVDEKGRLTGSARSSFSRTKKDLITAGQLIELDGLIWRL